MPNHQADQIQCITKSQSGPGLRHRLMNCTWEYSFPTQAAVSSKSVYWNGPLVRVAGHLKQRLLEFHLRSSWVRVAVEGPVAPQLRHCEAFWSRWRRSRLIGPERQHGRAGSARRPGTGRSAIVFEHSRP